MGVFDKLKDLVGIEDLEDEYYDEEFDDVPDRGERNSVERSRFTRAGRDNLLQMNRAVTDMKLVLIEPSGFDKAPKLVDSLKERKPIIVNLEKLDTDTARKIFDFLSGATYALGGNVQKIANNIFVFVPANVGIDPDESDRSADFTDMGDKTW